MNRIGFMVSTGCYPTREAAEAKKKLLEQKGVNAMVEDIDALTMRELVTAIMCVEKALGEIVSALDCNNQCFGELHDDIQDLVSAANFAAMAATKNNNDVENDDVVSETARAKTLSKLGGEILKYLQKNKMSQMQLAAKAGVGSGSISRVMYKELVTPKANTVAKIATAAEIPYSVYSRLIEEENR